MEQAAETKMKAFVRVRPIYCGESEKIVRPEGTSGRRIKLINPDSRAVDKSFRYDHIFDEQASQEELHEWIVPDMVNSFVDGLNVCLFAYGQTGSGKTYSIMGEHGAPGVLPRFCQDVFGQMGDLLDDDDFARIDVAFFEVYNEKVYDLLANSRVELKVRGTDPPQPENLTYYRIQSMQDFDRAIQQGLCNRSTAATKINELSSRSHAIFQIKLTQTHANDMDVSTNQLKGQLTLSESNAYFVDLAGSERVNHADSDRSEEGIAINKALLSLGNVIKQRARGDKFIAAVRDSLLTRLLKPCFSEDARTCLLATISPLPEAYPFTVKTLEFAENTSRIKQAAKRHYRIVDTTTGKNNDFGGVVPALTDVANIPYPRKQWIQWYTELAAKCPADSLAMEIDTEASLMVVPEFKIGGPDDVEAIQRIREFFAAHIAKRQGIYEAFEQNADIFEAKLKQRLCTADLDRQRVKDLEEEVHRLKGESSAQNGQVRQLQRENNALRIRLYKYESQQEQNRRREEGQRYMDAEREAALKSNRRTLQKVAELFESPIPTTSNVARLRKQFGSNEDLESCASGENSGGGSALSKTPKMITNTMTTISTGDAQPPTPKKMRQDGITNVKFYDAANRRRSPRGFVNPRYQRRSRSVGNNTSRVLNHQPVSKIPLGTVFQPKLPKSTKHTTQVDADDLKKHDEYMVTRQEVDAQGNVKTKLFKGEVTPTAGGGAAVHFNDVENLFQESPYKSP